VVKVEDVAIMKDDLSQVTSIFTFHSHKKTDKEDVVTELSNRVTSHSNIVPSFSGICPVSSLLCSPEAF